MTIPPGPENKPGFLPPHGGYEGLKAYQMYLPQTNYLLDQLLLQLEQAFLREGGFTERLYRARQQARALPPRPSFRRNRSNTPNPPQTSYPRAGGSANPPNPP